VPTGGDRFQLAEAGTLPEVAYLTFADRVYALCYTVLAAALMFGVYGNALVRRDRKDRARWLDRKARWAFPVGLMVRIVRSRASQT
jgi:hypothetical protein